MIARVLPAEQWSRLEPTQMPQLPGVRDVDVVVVEDGDKIVACLSVLKITHFEGLWIDPDKKGMGVPRALLRLALGLAEARGNEWVWAGAADDKMRGILTRVGGVNLALDSYVLNLGGGECRHQP